MACVHPVVQHAHHYGLMPSDIGVKVHEPNSADPVNSSRPALNGTRQSATVQNDEECSVDHFQRTIKSFLEGSAFNPPQIDPSRIVEIQRAATHHVTALRWDPPAIQRATKIISWVCDGTIRSYNHLSDSALRGITIFNTFLFLVDDISAQISPDLRVFATDLMARRDPSNPILRSLLDFLPSMRVHCGPVATDMLLVTTLDFFNGCLLELRPDDYRGDRIRGAVDFPPGFRLKTEETWLGVYQPYISSLIDLINSLNDWFPFYKASILGDESANFTCNRAKAEGILGEESLVRTKARTVQCLRVVREGFKGYPELLGAVEGFVSGLIAYHVTSPRYKLGRML
ncbi:hypothetical protein LTR62_005198 [Meristemomyces frigidus]|uniref:Trichodiene synthase n=1 Tax=Meristemomyces frigidus TaxID=1508187 RepID=A0AAN7TFP9_9PEZI|nr:hypothetical protein LTR62_005198 [Meristemomyces frigidus]